MRRRALRIGVVAAAIAVVILVRAPQPSAASHPSRFTLDLPLTVSDALPPLARRMLVSEANRIWEREGVRLQWSDPAAAAGDADASLRVLVLARPEREPKERRWPAAELV